MAERVYISVADTAKLVRKALAANFPGMKFSVRSSSYSGGASIRVSWTDGPTTKDVDKVVGGFAGASFDGMIDLKSYNDSIHPETGQRVHFGADYVFTEREYSLDFFTKIVTKEAKKWGEPVPEIKTTYTGSPYLGFMNYSEEHHYQEALSNARGEWRTRQELERQLDSMSEPRF